VADGPQFSTAVPGQIVLSCPQKPAPPKPLVWIEIELVGEDDQPVPGEEYRLVLPDGKVLRGYLDAKGSARVQNIKQAGACELTFTRLDREAWTLVTSRRPSTAERGS